MLQPQRAGHARRSTPQNGDISRGMKDTMHVPSPDSWTRGQYYSSRLLHSKKATSHLGRRPMMMPLLVVTSSNGTFKPNRVHTPFTEIMTLNYSRNGGD